MNYIKYLLHVSLIPDFDVYIFTPPEMVRVNNVSRKYMALDGILTINFIKVFHMEVNIGISRYISCT